MDKQTYGHKHTHVYTHGQLDIHIVVKPLTIAKSVYVYVC